MDCCDDTKADPTRRQEQQSLCVRHQRMANGGTNQILQKSLENLPLHDQEQVNQIWSLFSSSPSRSRLLILRGLLTIACPSQLTFLQDILTLEMRLDPLLVLPREVSLKLFGYLDAISLGRAAQVSHFWQDLADDDLLWRTMCEQHIEKKCEKCGWGLPLLGERKRKQKSNQNTDNPKRTKTDSPASSRPNTPPPQQKLPLITRPWKSVYCERLVIERNWRSGTFVSSILEGHSDSITCLQVAEDLPHPTFPILMTGSWDRSVRIWNLETGQEVGVLRGHTRGVRALQFDALKLVTGSMDSTLKIWNWRTGECMRTLRGHRDAVICLTYDQQLLISGSADSTLRVWDFGTGEGYSLRGHTEWVNSVALWDSKLGCSSTTPLQTPVGGTPTTNPEAAKASSKGKFLFSASDDMTIRVWDLYERVCVRTLQGHVAQVQSLRLIEDHDPSPPSPSAIATPSLSHVTSSSSATFARSTAITMTAPTRAQGNAYEGFFDVPSAHPSPLPSAANSPTSETIPLHSVLPPLAFVGDKRPLIISASLDNTIKVWDLESETCKRTMFGHIEGVWDVAVDKLRIVSGSHDRTLKIWDKESGRCLHTLVGHTSAVTSVLLLDMMVISGGDDGKIRIWNFASK